MPYVVMLDGAVEIWANTVHNKDKTIVDLPMIKIIKKIYKNSDVYITSTLKEVDALVECDAEIIILNAKRRN